MKLGIVNLQSSMIQNFIKQTELGCIVIKTENGWWWWQWYDDNNDGGGGFKLFNMAA